MGRSMIVGLDVGNYDTKTTHSTTSTGYGEYSKIPYGSTEALSYNNIYYVPDTERFPYVRDKTGDEKCFILSLFGIAKESLLTIANTAHCETPEELEEKIGELEVVHLGVGLPPAHISALSDKLKAYYKNYFKGGVDFSWYGQVKDMPIHIYDFHVNLGSIEVYPQDLTAALIAANMVHKQNDPNYITNRYAMSGYYAIDFGGYTVDVVPIERNVPRVKDCVSLELGVLRLYADIEKVVNREFELTLPDSIIQSVLMDEPTSLQPETKQLIKDEASEWVNQVFNQIRRGGLEFNAMPIVLLGGGSTLLRSQIENNKFIKNCEHTYISNPNANALGYYAFLKNSLIKK